MPAGSFRPPTDRLPATVNLFSDRRFLLGDRPILGQHLRSRVLTRSTIMGKIRQGNKEQKKQPLLTPKEKRSAKQAEKRATDIVPLVSR